jgi:hypothetical protein
LGEALTLTGALALLIGSGAATVAFFGDREISPTGAAFLIGGLVLLPLGIVRLVTARTALSFGPGAVW